ncbi:MAG: carboxypeptidase regulatory-like domain-containing protein [Schleiferiaceae bacterium]|nr:carboxypeptidase regulatory-like domain-containing protein [Schleiferiaceae bacterium]
MTRLLACSLILLAWSAKAQVALRGRVVDGAGRALPAVEVYLSGPQEFLATTDGQGRFAQQLPPGAYRLIVFGAAYQTLRQKLTLQKDTSLTITLQPLSQNLNEVDVQATRSKLGRKRLREVEGTALYAGKKSEVVVLDETPGNLAVNKARQVYAQVTGVNLYESSAGGLQLHIGGRGLDPSRTSNFNVRQNGYDISADVLGYPESYYTPPSEALEEIQVVRGAASLQYGTQFGGLLNFKLKGPPDKDTLLGQTRQTLGSNGLFTSYSRLAGKNGPWRYNVHYNFKRGDGFRPHSAFVSHNAYGEVGYHWGPGHSLSLQYTYLYYLAEQPGGLTDQQFARDPYQSPRRRNWFAVRWNLLSLQWAQQISTRSKFTLLLNGLHARRRSLGFRGVPAQLNTNPVLAPDEQDSEGNYRHPRDLISGLFRNANAEARLLTRYRLGGHRAVWLLGAKYYHAQNTSRQGPGSKGHDADFRFAQERFPDYANQSDFRFPNRNLAFFTEHIWYVSPKISITPGLRWEYIHTASRGRYQQVNFDNAGNVIFRDTLRDNRDLRRHFLLAGLGLSYKPDKQTEWYLNFSQNYRSVTFSDIRIVNPSFKIDPKLSDERGYTADLGYRGTWGEDFRYDFTAFGLYYGNRIGLIFNDRAQRVRTNIGTAFIYGLESFLRYPLRKGKWRWEVFSNLSLNRSRYLASQENNVVGNEVEFVPAVNWKVGSSWQWQQWQVSIQYSYLSSQYTDVENSEAPAPGDLRAGVLGPIPAYGVMDFSLAWRPGRWTLEAGINNLANARYFTRRATGYPGPGIIPAAPRTAYLTLGFRW